ncbi:MAG: MBL fold metallo-hydrolase [Desulfocapsaceae bacterium]|nr:MBL fold metallo-hydrolase [Desulfocapsaceae bacterium]
MTIQQHTVDTPYIVGPVHCYTALAAGELVLFDTGPLSRRGREYLQKNIDLAGLRHVMITHCHIDHYGLARWLETESGATVYLPYRDVLKIREHEYRVTQMYRILREIGFDRDYINKLDVIFKSDLVFPPFPENFRIIEEALPDYLGIGFLNCPGHSQSDVVFLGEDWAVTGDVLLRGIFQSPLLDINLDTGERFRNFEAYCDTLLRLATLRGRRIMPGHREKVGNVDTVILFYIRKLLERVAQLRPYADDDNIARIIARMFGDKMTDPFHMFLKASEILFMKDFLARPGRLQQALEQIGLYDAVALQFQKSLQ